ncbi:S46 family peptidase [bacterium]|nr:S46 family peptidase [bacterium]
MEIKLPMEYLGDAMHYDYVTTFDGLMAKKDNSDDEFMVPLNNKNLMPNTSCSHYHSFLLLG